MIPPLQSTSAREMESKHNEMLTLNWSIVENVTTQISPKVSIVPAVKVQIT